MLIALDYDDTYTRDPVFWDQFLELAVSTGHRVICLTMRYPEEAVSLSCEVFYTSRKAKKPYAAALMLHVDIWIDDAPHFILMDSMEITGRVAPSQMFDRDAAMREATGKAPLQALFQRAVVKLRTLLR